MIIYCGPLLAETSNTDGGYSVDASKTTKYKPQYQTPQHSPAPSGVGTHQQLQVDRRRPAPAGDPLCAALRAGRAPADQQLDTEVPGVRHAAAADGGRAVAAAARWRRPVRPKP